jgi:hypothetical protein
MVFENIEIVFNDCFNGFVTQRIPRIYHAVSIEHPFLLVEVCLKHNETWEIFCDIEFIYSHLNLFFFDFHCLLTHLKKENNYNDRKTDVVIKNRLKKIKDILFIKFFKIIFYIQVKLVLVLIARQYSKYTAKHS